MAGEALGLIDHDARPRPVDHRGKPCDFEWRGKVCGKRGAHYCEPRADKVVDFFREYLRHQKGVLAGEPFVLEGWQEHEIIRPLFGEVVWTEWGRYGRRYRLATIVLARKNGKTGLLAGCLLYLIVADGERGAEIYTAAIDTDQARLVFDPAANMVRQSPELAKLLRHNKQTRRLIDEERGSFFAVIPADAEGALGMNPHAVGIDEVLNQPNSKLFDALRTGMGSRVQPIMFLVTTETDDPNTFGAVTIDGAERVQEDPSRAWHHFVYVRKLPRDVAELERLHRIYPNHPDLPVPSTVVDDDGRERVVVDVDDERNWKWPNPALDGFLSRQVMREELADAKLSPTAMASFLQFRMNMRSRAATRFIPDGLWAENVGAHGVVATPAEVREMLLGRRAWAGLDLSSKLDLTAWLLMTDDAEILARFWVPEARLPALTEATGGRFAEWVAAGWVTLTEGDVIDYDEVVGDIERDATDFVIDRVVYDKWSGEPVRQSIEKLTGLEMVESGTTFERMTPPMKELERLLRMRRLQHLGNPVLDWMASNLEATRPRDDPDRIRPVKPARDQAGKHIDGMVTLLYAIDAQMSTIGETTESAYEDTGLRVV